MIRLLLTSILLCTITAGFTQVKPTTEWWLEEPYRLIQTNLREIDAIDFDMDTYIQSIVDIGANTVLINVGGIVANYYTDLDFHYRNPNLKFNLIEEAIERLHAEGIRVIGRFDFSKLNEKYAMQNPDWQFKSIHGETVNYNGQVHMCVNGGYQQEYALKILDEALSRFPVDGVFFNMSGYQVRDYSHNYIGICQSDACRNRFREWSGGLDLPKVESMDDPVFRQYQKFKIETAAEIYQKKMDLIKSFGDHIAICNYSENGTDLYRREANSHASIYNQSVPWEYHAADNVKRTIGSFRNKQVSNAAVHFYGFPTRHTADAKWLTHQRLVENAMHGGGLDFYCIGRLDNMEDREVLENVRDIFQFHKKNEDYLHHTVSGSKLLLLHDRISGNEYKGLFDILSENHILFDAMEHYCIDDEDVPRNIESYDLVILPEIGRLSEEQCRQLDSYVENGGRILATGLTSIGDELGNPMNRIRLKSLGVQPEFEPVEKIQGTYFRIFEKDKPALGPETFKGIDIVYAWEEGLLCKPAASANGYLGFIPPAMIGPPEKCYYEEVTDIPGLFHNKYGKGQTAFITFRIGTLYHHKRHYGHAAIVMAALQELLGYEQDLELEAHPLIEVSRQMSPPKKPETSSQPGSSPESGTRGEFEWYGLMNHSGQLGRGTFEPLPVNDIVLRFKPRKPASSVRSLKTGEAVDFSMSPEGWVKLRLPELDLYDFLLVEY